MRKLLRVLVVEDEAADAEMLLKQLTGGGHQVDSVRVESPALFEAALERRDWDLIVCDLTLPHFDAPTALKLLQRSGRDIPFLVVSGDISEDLAVRLMEEGADDCLSKNDLRRLLPAVARGLRDAKERRARSRAEEEQARLRSERDQLLERLKVENEDLEALGRVTENALSTLDLDRLLETLLKRFIEVLKADDAAILLREADRLVLRAAVGIPAEAYPAYTVLMGEGLAGRVAVAGSPIFIEEVQADPRAFHHQVDRGVRSVLGAPLKCGTELMGVLHVEWFNPHPFRARELRLVEVTAERCALALVNARTYSRVLGLEQQLELQLREMPLACLTWDAQMRVRSWNPAAARIFGYTAGEAIGKHVGGLLFPPEAVLSVESAHQRLFSEGKTVHTIHENHTKDRRRVACEWTCAPMCGVGPNPAAAIAMVQDITERQRLESQLLRAQRLEAIGTLASGVAHDLNNILTPIVMAAPLLRMEQDRSSVESVVELVESSARRGADIVRQLLTLGRGSTGQRVPVQVRHVLREIRRMIYETFPRSITVRLSIADDLWPVVGDATQIHQVVLNLCLNARDAMTGDGVLELRAHNTQLDANFAAMHTDASPGPHVILEVTDTGHGIAPEDLNRVFDPFFTTKAPGKGTGLGLASVACIARNHGGFVLVSSLLGKGTTFRVYLPATPDSRPEPPLAPDPGTLHGHNELVLVVDDEPHLRAILQKSLENGGYRVVLAEHGAAALAKFAEHRGEIRALVTDLMMPVMGGNALVHAVRNLAPDLPVVVSSGLAEGADQSASLAQLRALGVEVFLSKPYSANALLEALGRLLKDHHGGSLDETLRAFA